MFKEIGNEIFVFSFLSWQAIFFWRLATAKKRIIIAID